MDHFAAIVHLTATMTPSLTIEPDASVAPECSHQPFSYQLPYELEREICEIVAYNFPKCILGLLLIARRFRIWFEPELYRVIRSGEGRVIPPLYDPPVENNDYISAVLDKPRIQRFGRHVQHVLLQNCNAGKIAEVLKCCPNVFNLALWMIQPEGRTCDTLIPILENLPLRKLSIDPSGLFQDYSIDSAIPFNQPMFVNLTHLDIINCTTSWSKWNQLALLPKLTHLSVGVSRVDQKFVDHVLEECRTVVLVVLLYDNVEFLTVQVPQKDDRVVLLKDSEMEDLLDEWEKGVGPGVKDFWSTAEILREQAIQARRAGAPNPSNNVLV